MSLRVAVVGVGHLGRHHARIYAKLPGVELAGVADLDLPRAGEVAKACGTRAYADFREIPGPLHAVSVAVPTAAHHAVASHFLSAGVPCLVEKPMTGSPREAESLVRTAREKGILLQPGYVERFNPAIRAAASAFRQPRFVEAVRVAPLKFRSLDIGVVMDLMVHDLDIVLWLAGGEPSAVEAVGVSVLTGREDLVNARLRFPNGCVADLTASRVSLKTVREIRVFQDDAYFSIDYAERRLKSCRKRPGASLDPAEAASLAASGKDLAALMGRFLEFQDAALEEEEPLAAELKAFLSAVRGESAPVVTGEDALRVLRVAERIRAEVGGRRPRVLFLCTGNSCRSQMAEGWFRTLAPAGWTVESAGTNPIGLHPGAVSIMAEAGVDISGHRSKGVTPAMLAGVTHVVTVCGHADQRCPAPPPGISKEHWPIPDPAVDVETFRVVRDDLKRRVGDLIRRLGTSA